MSSDELIYDFNTGRYVREQKQFVGVESTRKKFNGDVELIYDYGFGGYIPSELTAAQEALKSPALRKIFDKAFDKVQFNRALANRIMYYGSSIFSREGNVEWFGSNLLGVHTIRFYDSDRNKLFDEILEIDEDLLTELIKETELIDKNWNVASDTFNLIICYMIHRFYAVMTDKVMYNAAVELVMVLQFKFYSSIYYHFFSKPVDLPAAEATYSMLSLKFEIRRLGNWGLHLRERAEYFVSKECPHYKVVKNFDEPMLLIRFITDLNTRTKQTVKYYYAVLDNVRRNNSRVVTQNTRVELDGESIIRDKVTAFNTAKQNLFEASYSVSSLYKEELARVVLEMVPKASPNAFKTLMVYMASQPIGKKRQEVESIMEDAIAHAFDVIVSNRINFTDVAFLLRRLQALYQVSKSPSPLVVSLRDRIEKLAKRETHLTPKDALAAVRTAVLLYLLLRAIAV